MSFEPKTLKIEFPEILALIRSERIVSCSGLALVKAICENVLELGKIKNLVSINLY